VVAGKEEGRWRPAPGYRWLNDTPGDFRVVWAPGTEHPDHPHVVAGRKEGEWRPAPGYRWLNDTPGDFRVVRAPGRKDPVSDHLSIVMAWRTEDADLDLRVVEPSGEECWHKNLKTRSGGQLDRDCRKGPGQETYVNPNPPRGEYRISVQHWSDQPAKVCVQVSLGRLELGRYLATLADKGDSQLIHTIHVPPTDNCYTVVANWETKGADVDIRVLGPGRLEARSLTDCTKGPGKETCIIADPRPGNYKIQAWLHAADRGGQQTPIAVRILRGRRVVREARGVLSRKGRVEDICTLDIPGAASGELGIVMDWRTEDADLDLRVEEPSGEKCWMENRNTRSGGQFGRDCQKGPGEEAYVNPNPPLGEYTICFRRYKGEQPTRVVVGVSHGAFPLRVWRQRVSKSGKDWLSVGKIRPLSENDYVVVGKWDRKESNVDIRVSGDEGVVAKHVINCREGPAREVCIIRDPAPGRYKIQAVLAAAQDGQQTPITVQILRSNRVVREARGVLPRRDQIKDICTLEIRGTAREDEKADLWVLAVGIRDYPGTDDDLKWCDKDAQRLAACLKRQEGTLYRKVNVLELPNDKATRASLSDARRTFLANTQPQDVVLIFLSGHGNRQGFVAYDGLYTWQSVRNELMSGLAARKIVLMIDACRAGAVGAPLRGAPRAPGPREPIKARSLKDIHRELANATGCYVFMGCSETGFCQEFSLRHRKWPRDVLDDRRVLQRVACFPLGRDLYGVFAFAVIDGLYGGLSGRATGPDGTMSVLTLSAHVDRICRYLRDATATRWWRPPPIKQRPCLFVPTNSRDFPLALYPHLRKADELPQSLEPEAGDRGR